MTVVQYSCKALPLACSLSKPLWYTAVGVGIHRRESRETARESLCGAPRVLLGVRGFTMLALDAHLLHAFATQ